jgi:hypothetical protein
VCDCIKKIEKWDFKWLYEGKTRCLGCSQEIVYTPQKGHTEVKCECGVSTQVKGVNV